MPTTTDRITKTPGVCGGRACIRGTRIPVWVLYQWKQLGQTDDWILAGYPGMTVEDLRAAWEYVAGNTAEIEDDIRVNAEA